MHVAVRNYREPAKVCVTHQRAGHYRNSDTLNLKGLDDQTSASLLIRENTSDSSYCFIAPKGYEVHLQPIALGTPIQQVRIINAHDSVLTVNLWNGRALRKLKRAGIIKTKAFIFTHSIFIENK
jgi:hypothetical protein